MTAGMDDQPRAATGGFALHGEAALPEYLTAAGMCSILAIHDFEQLSEASQQQVASRFVSCTTSDDQRGRRLFVGWK